MVQWGELWEALVLALTQTQRTLVDGNTRKQLCVENVVCVWQDSAEGTRQLVKVEMP